MHKPAARAAARLRNKLFNGSISTEVPHGGRLECAADVDPGLTLLADDDGGRRDGHPVVADVLRRWMSTSSELG
jgi:hypothetical protein